MLLALLAANTQARPRYAYKCGVKTKRKNVPTIQAALELVEMQDARTTKLITLMRVAANFFKGALQKEMAALSLALRALPTLAALRPYVVHSLEMARSVGGFQEVIALIRRAPKILLLRPTLSALRSWLAACSQEQPVVSPTPESAASFPGMKLNVETSKETVYLALEKAPALIGFAQRLPG